MRILLKIKLYENIKKVKEFTIIILENELTKEESLLKDTIN